MEDQQTQPQQKKFQGFKVRCPIDRQKAYAEEAVAQGRSLSDWIRRLAEAELACVARRKLPVR